MKAIACATGGALISTKTLAKGQATEHDKTVFQSFDQAVSQYEFEWQTYKVVTEDGYILNMFRLVGPSGST